MKAFETIIPLVHLFEKKILGKKRELNAYYYFFQR
jgi:hypothetical protein